MATLTLDFQRLLHCHDFRVDIAADAAISCFASLHTMLRLMPLRIFFCSFEIRFDY